MKPIEIFTAIYNLGYGAGHHDTVESQYTDIHQLDIGTYHEDVVLEILKDLGIKPEDLKL